jgi:hypothetical protein
LILFLGIACLGLSLQARPLEVSYDRESAKLSVDATGQPLLEVLGHVTAETGWQIFIEPDANPAVETQFQDVGVGRGIELLVGRMNYALLPQSDGPTRLFVFRTSRDQATLRVDAAGDEKLRITIRRVGNELIVTVEPGTDIEALAQRLGAKVTGHLEGTHTYRLTFEDDDAANTAKGQLADEPGAKGVDYNYYVDKPAPPKSLEQGPAPPVSLSLNPPPDDGAIVVGLVDTAVQSLGGDLDQFLLPSESVAGKAVLPKDRLTHGSSMAETILRSIEQTSSGGTSIQILPVDIYGANQNATSFDVALGITTAVNKGADIVNLSLGSYGGAPYLEKVIQDASAEGIVFFGAAGNEPVADPVYPAAYPEVIAVTAAQDGRLARYANYGEFVDMVAPGSSVVYFNGQPYSISGTSTAAAYASGLAAAVAESQQIDASKAAALVTQQNAFSSGLNP